MQNSACLTKTCLDETGTATTHRNYRVQIPNTSLVSSSWSIEHTSSSAKSALRTSTPLSSQAMEPKQTLTSSSISAKSNAQAMPAVATNNAVMYVSECIHQTKVLSANLAALLENVESQLAMLANFPPSGDEKLYDFHYFHSTSAKEAISTAAFLIDKVEDMNDNIIETAQELDGEGQEAT